MTLNEMPRGCDTGTVAVSSKVVEKRKFRDGGVGPGRTVERREDLEEQAEEREN